MFSSVILSLKKNITSLKDKGNTFSDVELVFSISDERVFLFEISSDKILGEEIAAF